MAIMTDHACREWCTKPNTKNWWRAALKQWRFDHPEIQPRVKISNAHPDAATAIVFPRRMK